MILSIDLETYSALDIKTVGGYRYAENAEILLLAYAWDDAPVQIVDLTAGETIPADVLSALTDNGITKCAFNAQFERTVLSHYLHKEEEPFVFLDPTGWSCTMVHAMTLGLPGSLAEVSKALKLGEDKEKMSVGTQLITYFCKPCKPTKSNGGRTRNLPDDAPEKWETFKAYCVRDVEAEREVRRRLSSYPVSETERALWALDQRINDRGVRIDEALAQHAITFDRAFRAEVTAEASALSGLENPNSGEQLKHWIYEQEGTRPLSLTKETIPELIATAKSETVKQVLRLKMLLSKTSVKKYEAMIQARCNDGRAHGLLQFYGANRTGRWCLSGDHEVLTPTGWTRLDEWEGGEIACWSSATEYISFQKADSVKFEYTGDLYQIDSQRCAQLATPDHKMPYMEKSGLWAADTIENLASRRFLIPFNGYRIIECRYSDTPLRVLVMTQADGHYTKEALRFHFKKQRKIERCKTLLRKAGLVYAIQQNGDGSTVISLKRRDLPMWLRLFHDKSFGAWLLNESADTFFDELEHWDAYRCGPNSIQYVTTVKHNADWVQALAHLSGRAATIVRKTRGNEAWKDAYVVNIWLTPGKGNQIRKEYISTKPYSGKVYCAATKTGFFVVRRNGRVWITGNSGRLVQVQNLPRNTMAELDDARALLRCGDTAALEMLFDSPPDVLSQLIRTAFIPAVGMRFTVADFSAIEARVIAWLAGEKWRTDVFADGGDIYCASASKMFHVPVEKHGVNGHLRQKGKVAELALGYGGGAAALKRMGADKLGLTDAELEEIKQNWRKASPRIVRLWSDFESAALEAVRERSTVSLQYGIKLECRSGILFIRLPSGRSLAYVKPRIEYEESFDREGLTYYGRDVGGWGKQRTYGGRLVENAIQAIARDCLAVAMTRLEAAGYPIVMHIHDEVVVETTRSTDCLADVCEIMSKSIDWAPGLVLTADGYVTDYYKKD